MEFPCYLLAFRDRGGVVLEVFTICLVQAIGTGMESGPRAYLVGASIFQAT